MDKKTFEEIKLYLSTLYSIMIGRLDNIYENKDNSDYFDYGYNLAVEHMKQEINYILSDLAEVVEKV